MISPQQLRAGRALLGLSKNELARQAGLPVEAVDRAEMEGTEWDDVMNLRKFLEGAGLAFIANGDDGGGPGVRLIRPQGAADGIRPENLNATNDG
ncbi:DNA-binding protein [Martelella alba]|uniref:DNA-binding protein n=1 Tax=Martelella alba TaxID=2590451 RepID=A0A506UJG0_9HYPH|nr:DNA-binding protein [Martelella alba]TPW33393.1 DNA-binding protein [Martelella alba]